VEYRYRLTGTGRRQVTAHGLADAEAQVEKEWARSWPEGRLLVRDVTRLEGGALTAVFEVGYEITVELDVSAGSDDEARREAFRRARSRVQETPFRRAAWERAAMLPPP
jgi:hypothetical protein